MPSVEISLATPLPALIMSAELLAVLRAIAGGTPPYSEFSLMTDLRDLHLPVGTLSIPVAVELGMVHGKKPQRIDFTLRAKDKTAFFPTFAGSLRCDPSGPSKTTAWLVGEYTAPGGAVGAFIDRSALNCVAVRSLTRFLQAVVSDAEANARKHEQSALHLERFNS